MSPPPQKARLGLLVPWLILLSSSAAALEFDARAKLFGTGAALPSHNLQRQLAGTPAYDYTADLRLMLVEERAEFTFKLDHSLILNGGDSFAFLTSPGATLDQSPTDDDLRLMDLTWEIDSGSRHQLVHRLDRLAMQYRGGTWGLTIGRDAVSWGNGLVFQPMDLFNPFAPTTVDRDYKAGDDLVIVDKLFSDGSDLQLLGILRRDFDGDASDDVASAAAKWHAFVGAGEFELFAGKHYRDHVFGGSLRVPLGGALVRADLVATHLRGELDDGGWRVSGVLNVDTSFAMAGRTAYVFAEYYHNDFGVTELPDSFVELPAELVLRLARGEVFNLMQDYLALGGTYEWHALWNQSLTLITNLGDASGLLQTQLSYTPSDHSTVQAGVLVPIGSAGDEFGGVPVFGEAVTSGGALQGYLRWVYYF
ncbi:MAG: hypothetical protein OES38_03930 [Gammaproteobacteria bacterium]|nr:hypothetical protein [Gammaproteobacteria bacterium]